MAAKLLNANADFFSELVFDSRGLTGERKREAGFGRVLRETLLVYAAQLAKAALCVPEGQTAYHKSKNFLFVITREGRDDFLVTIRNQKAGLSFHGRTEHIGEEKNFSERDIVDFLGSISDFGDMMRSAGLVIGVTKQNAQEFSERLTVGNASEMFLGTAGHEDSPERAHFRQRMESGEKLWVARPA